MHVDLNEIDERKRLREASAVLTAGGVTNGLLGTAKILLGNFTGYLPLTASGIHTLSDIVSDAVAWIAVLIGGKSARHGDYSRFHYGRRRVETLLALLGAFLIAYVSVELILDAFGHHEHGHGMATTIEEAETRGIENGDHGGIDEAPPADKEEILDRFLYLIAGAILISLLAKETLFKVTRRRGKRLNSPMLIAKAWHHRADSISSLAVLVSLGISSFFPHLELIDQITTVVIASLILRSAWEVGSNSVKELIDFAPSRETTALVEEMAERVEGVTFTHNIRIRSMGGALHVELTAETDPEITVAEGYAVVRQIREKIMERVPDVIDVTTMLTPKGEYLRQLSRE